MPDKEIMVSVLVITFNHLKFIKRCLDSMVNQKTDFRYEIIIHDDASTDGTAEIVREYAERYPDLIIPILQEKNQYSQGVNFVKDFLFPLASGEYIIELEGDDFWSDENKLQLQVDALKNHPDCSLCVHSTGTVDVDGNKLEYRFPMMELDEGVITTQKFMELTLNENNWPFHQSALMANAELYREYMELENDGFPSKFFSVGDLPRYLFFGLKGNTYYIDREMTVYTMDSGGFMSRINVDPEFARKVYQGYIDGLTEFDAYSNYVYSDQIHKMLVPRRFGVARIDRRFDLLVSNPEYDYLIQERGFLKGLAYRIIGHAMRLSRKIRKERT